MKRKVSFVVLVIFTIFIAGITIYTLMNKGIKDEVATPHKKEVELINENFSSEEASLLFNIYLNQIRHKFKISYDVIKEEKAHVLKISIYFDGKPVLSKVVINDLKNKNVLDLWNDLNYKDLKKNINSFKIINSGSTEFLLFEISSINTSNVLEYYVINGEGNLLESDGVLARDSKKAYISDNNKDLNIFYDDNYLMAKIENNIIYALVEKKENNKLVLEEYQYKIINNNFEKELIRTYKNVSLKENKK